MIKELRSENTDRVFEAIMKMRNKDELYDFFEDICTVKEVKDMSQRFEVACLLNNGMSYQKVSELTNVSSATISRVKRCLDYGSGGYLKAIERMKNE